MTQHIMFDFDGTLVDTSEGIIKSMHYAFDQMGVPRVEDCTIANVIGPPLEKMISILLHTEDNAYIKRAVSLFRERYSIHGVMELQLYPRVVSTLKELKSTGRKLYIVTSKPQIYVEEICRKYDILSCFSGITGVELLGNNLSKGDRMRLLMDKYSITPENAVMVGDRPEDAYAATQNKVECIGIGYGFSNEEDLKGAGCNKVLNYFEQLIEAITK